MHEFGGRTRDIEFEPASVLCSPLYGNPSCLHTTSALAFFHPLSHIVFHTPKVQISTRPAERLPPAKRISPSSQSVDRYMHYSQCWEYTTHSCTKVIIANIGLSVCTHAH